MPGRINQVEGWVRPTGLVFASWVTDIRGLGEHVAVRWGQTGSRAEG